MFGFLQLKGCGLTPQEHQIYRSHFCAVCHAMTEFGGKVSSLLTNYDITFWLLLCSALDSGKPTELQSLPCTAVPFRRVAVRPLNPEVARTMASLNLLLVSSKAEDDRADGEKLKAGVARALFGKRFEKAQAYLKENGFPVEQVLELPRRQALAEAEKAPTLESLCLATQITLGEIFVAIAGLQRKPELEKPLRRFGETLGGYLYLWDALTDLESDREKSRFNALEATQSGGTARLKEEFYGRLDRLKNILDSMALGPEGKLCYALLDTLREKLRKKLPAPTPGQVASPRSRLARAGMVRAQCDCCEVDCCECGSCCDCNVCDCTPGDGTHCVDCNCCDCCDTVDVCCCWCDSSRNNRYSTTPLCRGSECGDCFYLESWCCGENRTRKKHNFVTVSSHNATPSKPGFWQRIRGLTSVPTLADSKQGVRKCPSCDIQMITLTVGETPIEECRNCGGLWLDDQEIEILAATARLPHNLLSRYPTGEHPPQNPPGHWPCPACQNSTLVNVPYLDVPVEMCRECRGFWLPHGVLRKVLRAKRSPRRLMASHKKEWRCPYCEQVAAAGSDVCANCGAPRPKSGFTGKLA